MVSRILKIFKYLLGHEHLPAGIIFLAKLLVKLNTHTHTHTHLPLSDQFTEKKILVLIYKDNSLTKKTDILSKNGIEKNCLHHTINPLPSSSLIKNWEIAIAPKNVPVIKLTLLPGLF